MDKFIKEYDYKLKEKKGTDKNMKKLTDTFVQGIDDKLKEKKGIDKGIDKGKDKKIDSKINKRKDKKIDKKIDNKIKNKFGFVKNTRKDKYCELIKEGTYSKEKILSIVKKEFGSASPNAFSFFLRDLRLKRIKVYKKSILSFKK